MPEQLQLSFLGTPVGCGEASGSRAGLSSGWFGVTVLTQRGDCVSQSSPSSRLEVNSVHLCPFLLLRQENFIPEGTTVK